MKEKMYNNFISEDAYYVLIKYINMYVNVLRIISRLMRFEESFNRIKTMTLSAF